MSGGSAPSANGEGQLQELMRGGRMAEALTILGARLRADADDREAL